VLKYVFLNDVLKYHVLGHKLQKGLRIYPPTVSVLNRTVPYRFPRGTVLVDRTAYRTFLTVFRDFCLKARTLPRFKFYRSAVYTLIFRKSANRTLPKHEPFFVILNTVGSPILSITPYRTLPFSVTIFITLAVS
jgi:hypothetical protein